MIRRPPPPLSRLSPPRPLPKLVGFGHPSSLGPLAALRISVAAPRTRPRSALVNQSPPAALRPDVAPGNPLRPASRATANPALRLLLQPVAPECGAGASPSGPNLRPDDSSFQLTWISGRLRCDHFRSENSSGGSLMRLDPSRIAVPGKESICRFRPLTDHRPVPIG